MNISFQLGIFFASMLASVAIGLLVLLRHPERFLNRSFALFVLGIASWGSSIAALYLTHDFFFSSLVFMSGALWFVGLLFFSYSFPGGKVPPRRFFLLAIPAALVFMLAPFNVFVTGFVVGDQGYLEPINDPAFFVPFMLVFLGYVASSLFLIVRNYRSHRESSRYRRQFHYFFIGVGVLVLSILVFDTILPALKVYRYNLLGPAAAVVFFLCTAYAVGRHQLLDLRIIVQRGLVYTLLSGIIVGAYIAAVSLAGYAFHNLTNVAVVAVAAVTTLMGVFGVPVLERYFRFWTDPLFFKDRYDYGQALHQLSRILFTSLNQHDIIESSRSVLERIFKTDDIEFCLDANYVPDEEQAYRPGFSTLTVPIVFQERTTGCIRLGEKKSGDAYTSEDYQLVSTFAYQAAVALEKARLYEKVERHSQSLEAEVASRTAEIKKLQEDQRQAMIDISHNLQTPLAVMKGELDLLSPEQIGDGSMRKVKGSIDQVSQFIRQLLRLAKLEGDVQAIEQEPVNLSALVSEQIEYFEVMAEDKGVRIIPHVVPGLWVVGDAQLLAELLRNLVVNAIKYRRPNVESTVWISLKEKEGKVELVVRDNGIGIAEKNLSEIFMRFYRIAPAMSEDRGTGLGLAIVRTIVEKHRGKVSVSSVVDTGTAFTVELDGRSKKKAPRKRG